MRCLFVVDILCRADAFLRCALRRAAFMPRRARRAVASAPQSRRDAADAIVARAARLMRTQRAPPHAVTLRFAYAAVLNGAPRASTITRMPRTDAQRASFAVVAAARTRRCVDARL